MFSASAGMLSSKKRKAGDGDGAREGGKSAPPSPAAKKPKKTVAKKRPTPAKVSLLSRC